MDNDIGLQQLAFAISEAALCVIFEPFAQAGLLEDAFQDNLTPGALRLGVTLECLGQVFGVFTNLLVELLKTLYFFDQRVAFFAFGGVNVGDFFLEIGNLLFERCQDCGQVGFALVGKGLCLARFSN
jgi:hypothetical protein